MGFEHIRVSKAGAAFNHHHRRASNGFIQSRSEGCLDGGFYKTPTSSQSIDSLQPINITWDSSCLTPANDKVDIYLYAPKFDNPRLHLWSGVTFSDGSYSTALYPRWWNSSASIDLQLLIIQHGDAPFLATLPAGPVFTATYEAPNSGVTPAVADTSLSSGDSGLTKVDAKPEPPSSHRGKMAAAILLPLLLLIALGVFAYFKLSRLRGKEKRRVFAEGVDKRMSTISADWKSMSVAGAQAAIRNSMAVGEGVNPRSSSFSFGAIRPPSSIYNTDGHGQAGIGAMYNQDGSSAPQMTQLPSHIRPGLRSSAYSNQLAASRVSRVSFADSPNPRPRPSGESRRSAYERRSQVGQSRALHFSGDEDMPPMPENAAERASMFVGGINPYLNVSRTTLDSGASPASRLSHFDEVYGEGDDSRVNSMYAAYAYGGEEEDVMSPKQKAGAVTLSEGDIKHRALGASGAEEDVGPALSMMRAQEQEDTNPHGPARLPSFPTPVHYNYTSTASPINGSETIFTTSPVTPGFPQSQMSFAQAMSESPITTASGAHFNSTYTSNTSYFPPTLDTTIVSSPVSDEPASPKSPMTGMAPPVVGMSPDDMLRMYAERNRAGTASRGTPSPLGANRTTTTANDGGSGARPILPAGPGSYSATRGAYGVSGLDD